MAGQDAARRVAGCGQAVRRTRAWPPRAPQAGGLSCLGLLPFSFLSVSCWGGLELGAPSLLTGSLLGGKVPTTMFSWLSFGASTEADPGEKRRSFLQRSHSKAARGCLPRRKISAPWRLLSSRGGWTLGQGSKARLCPATGPRGEAQRLLRPLRPAAALPFLLASRLCQAGAGWPCLYLTGGGGSPAGQLAILKGSKPERPRNSKTRINSHPSHPQPVPVPRQGAAGSSGRQGPPWIARPGFCATAAS